MKSSNHSDNSLVTGTKQKKPTKPLVSLERVEEKAGAAQCEIVEEALENSLLARKAKEIIHALPDVRKDKVRKLKRAIKSGKYHVDSEAIAERLIADHIETSHKKKP